MAATQKDAYSVEVIGFSQTEQMALSSVFELSSRRVPKFVRHAKDGTKPDIFLVDADDMEAIRQLLARDASEQIPAILIGDSNRGTCWPLLARPIRWMKLFQAFDAAIAAQQTGIQAKPADTSIPAKTASIPSSSAAIAQTSASAPGAGTSAKPEADWVLVVDDNQTVREFMKSKLAAFNFNVDYAESGEQAIGFTGQKHYACIFLDVVMPGIDGYQVCKLIKSNRSARKTAVVMLTSKDSPFDKIRGSMSGCDAYLTKPVDEEKLLETIAKFVPS
ncbi:MAG: response regulator [Nitrosomonadales bacterium]|nr:response regulator [Nitrosomonadales bacterium]